MKSNYDLIYEQKYLIFSAIVIGFIFIFAGLINQEEFSFAEGWYPTDVLFIVIPGISIAIGLILNSMYKGRGNHGVAWILITLALICWLVGETTYEYDNEYDIEDISTFTADIFYLIGYPLFFGFAIFYLKPRKNIISKKLITSAILVSAILVIPSIMIMLEQEEESDSVNTFIVSIYPFMTGIILVPAIIGMTLFFRGQVNFLWTMILLGLFCDVIADVLYLTESLEGMYDASSVANIFYIWCYLLLIFGMYSHVKLYKNPPKEDVTSMN